MKTYRIVYLVIENIDAEDEEDAFQAFLELANDGDLIPTREDLQIEELKGDPKC